MGRHRLSSGTVALSLSALSVGTHSISVAYTASDDFMGSYSPVLSQVVNKATGHGNVLTASATSTTYGQSVTLTDSLAHLAGTAPADTVTFLNGSTVLGTGTLNSAGVATLTTTSLPVGSDPVTAVYAGNSTYGASTSNAVTLTVAKIPSLSSDSAKGSGTYGAVSVPVAVTIPYNGTTPPSGLVEVNDLYGNMGTVLGASCPAASGILACTVNFPTLGVPAGANPLTVAQAADANHSGNTGSGSLAISKAVSATTLSASSAIVTAGSAVVLTAQVASAAGVPTGTVTFLNGSTVLGTAMVSSAGLATLTVADLTAGTLSTTASDGGDTNNLVSSSAPVAASIQDFSIAATGGTPSVAVAAGSVSVFTLALTPSTAGFSNAISLSAAGLPAGTTFHFSPATVTPGSAVVSTILTVQTESFVTTARNLGDFSGTLFALLGVPFCLSRKARRMLRQARLTGTIGVVLLLLAGMAGLSGCGMERIPYEAAQSYTITVSATSGILSHSTTVVLNVQ